MATNRMEGAKGGTEGAKPEAEKGSAGGAAPGGGASGCGKSWMPLVLNLVLMPVLAYVMTSLVLVPKIKKTVGGKASTESSSSGGAHGKEKSGSKGHGEDGEVSGNGEKTSVPLSSKVLVNVSGSQGARYLQANITLVGEGGEGLKKKIESADSQLRDLAAGLLCSKTIVELEKPGARNVIKSELKAAFNTAIGPKYSIQDIYLTDFAIQ